MAKQLVTKAAFAGLCGIDRSAVTVQCRKSGLLASTVVDGKIDAGHRDARAYLRRHKARAKAACAPTKSEDDAKEPTGVTDDGTPGFAASLEDLTLRQIGEKFGGWPQFESKLRALKVTEEVREKRLKNDEADGTLIPRELVATHVFGAIDGANKRLLTDTVRTIVRTVYANAKSGIAVEASERQVRGIISKVLEPVKRKAVRALREG